MPKTEPHADSRDMVVLHDMFRREFRAIPALVSNVPTGDDAQVRIIADHVVWMVTFLHTHHQGEDELIWPKLLERAPDETKPLVHTMEAQHGSLDLALQHLEATAIAWRETRAEPQRHALAAAATDLLPLITEHLALEEREVLPLIDAYLTNKEWLEVGPHGMKKMSFGQITIAFGMILNGATPEKTKIMHDTIPRVPWTIFSIVGPRAYTKYAKTLYPVGASAHPASTTATS